MIRSFRDEGTRDVFDGRDSREARRLLPLELRKVAGRRLDQLNRVSDVQDLRHPPGNRLERLRGDLADWWSIRINDRLCIIFHWVDGGAVDVGIVDYH
jgi:proteic killer suppression protein